MADTTPPEQKEPTSRLTVIRTLVGVVLLGVVLSLVPLFLS